MTDNIPEEYYFGLTDEEVDDLENLINTLKEDPSLSKSGAAFEEIKKRKESTTKHLIELGEMILRFNTELQSFYEIIRLSHKKSEIMNKRLNALIEWAKRMKNRKQGESHSHHGRNE